MQCDVLRIYEDALTAKIFFKKKLNRGEEIARQYTPRLSITDGWITRMVAPKATQSPDIVKQN